MSSLRRWLHYIITFWSNSRFFFCKINNINRRLQISCYHYINWFVLHTFQKYNCIKSSVQLQYIKRMYRIHYPLHWSRWMIDSLFYYLHYKWLHTHQWIIRKRLKLIVNLSVRIHIFQSRFGNNYFPDFTTAYVYHAIAVEDSFEQCPLRPMRLARTVHVFDLQVVSFTSDIIFICAFWITNTHTFVYHS